MFSFISPDTLGQPPKCTTCIKSQPPISQGSMHPSYTIVSHIVASHKAPCVERVFLYLYKRIVPRYPWADFDLYFLKCPYVFIMSPIPPLLSRNQMEQVCARIYDQFIPSSQLHVLHTIQITLSFGIGPSSIFWGA